MAPLSPVAISLGPRYKVWNLWSICDPREMRGVLGESWMPRCTITAWSGFVRSSASVYWNTSLLVTLWVRCRLQHRGRAWMRAWLGWGCAVVNCSCFYLLIYRLFSDLFYLSLLSFLSDLNSKTDFIFREPYHRVAVIPIGSADVVFTPSLLFKILNALANILHPCFIHCILCAL